MRKHEIEKAYRDLQDTIRQIGEDARSINQRNRELERQLNSAAAQGREYRLKYERLEGFIDAMERLGLIPNGTQRPV